MENVNQATPRQNLILASLSPQTQREVAKDLSPIVLPQKAVLNAPGTTPDVVFPLTGIVSVMTQTEGNSAENFVIGFDGVFILPPLLNVRGVVQLPGEAFAMPRAAYVRHLERDDFRRALGHYRDQSLAFACQAATCQAYHTAEQRLAFWLLAVRDRIPSDELSVTHENLATILGVQRPTVTIAARILQSANVIQYRYGRITILDREALQDAACECYRFSATLLEPRDRALARLS